MSLVGTLGSITFFTTMASKEFTQVGHAPMSRADIEARIRHGDSFQIKPSETGTQHLVSGQYGRDTYTTCQYKHCSMKSRCRGHGGYYELLIPIPNPLFIKNILEALQLLRFTSSDSAPTVATKRDTTQVVFEKGQFEWSKKAASQLSPTELKKNTTTRVVQRSASTMLAFQWATELLATPDVRKTLGYNDVNNDQPSVVDCFMWYIPVPPNLLRPSGRSASGADVVNFITIIFSTALKAARDMNALHATFAASNTTRDTHETADTIAQHICRIYSALTAVMLGLPQRSHVSTLQALQLPRNVTIPSHADYKPYMGVLTGKEGLIKGTIMTKRTDRCARAPITPSLKIGIDQVGIPRSFFKHITVTETHNNRQYEVMLHEGCIVMLGRYPTMTKLSLQGAYVVAVDGLTIQINPAVTPCYNADFDGDEMNIFVLTTSMAKAEAVAMMLPSCNILSPLGDAAIYPVQDCVTGPYVAIRDDHHLACALARDIYHATRFDPLESWESFNTRAGHCGRLRYDFTYDEYSARILLSCTMPSSFNYKDIVRHGIIQPGIVLTASLQKAIIVFMCHTEKNDSCGRFITLFQQNSSAINRTLGLTVTYRDIVLSPAKIAEIQATARREYRDIPVDCGQEEKGIMMHGVVTRAHVAARALMAGSRNGIADIVDSGAKGKETHLMQMTTMIGIQSVNGAPPRKNLPRGRVLPHVCPDAMPEINDGLILSSFSSGANPYEFFMHAMSARENIVESSISVSSAGAESKELGKFSENMVVADSSGTILRYNKIISMEPETYVVDSQKSRLLQVLADPLMCDDYISRILLDHAA